VICRSPHLQVFGIKGQIWRFGPVLDIHILQGLVEIAAEDKDVVEDEALRALLEEGTPLYGWWKEGIVKGSQMKKEAVEETISKVIEHIALLGGVDGIIGFSQGGELACLLAERVSEINSTPGVENKLGFVAVFGMEDIFAKCGHSISAGTLEPLKTGCREISQVRGNGGLALFVSQGADDAEACGESIVEVFKEAGVPATAIRFKVFEGGHAMPTDAAVFEAMRDLVLPYVYKLGTPEPAGQAHLVGEEEPVRPPIPEHLVPVHMRIPGVTWTRIEY